VTFRKIDKKPAEIIIEESEKRKEPVSGLRKGVDNLIEVISNEPNK
jgi:hypothetical protein